MRNFWGLSVVCFVAGCAAGSPPKPPVVTGEYQPINRVEMKGNSRQASASVSQRVTRPAGAGSMMADVAIPNTFDFSFESDITNALPALRIVQPQLAVLPTQGKPSPLPVRLFLRGATLEAALRQLGEQGGRTADVVIDPMPHADGIHVFIRFKK